MIDLLYRDEDKNHFYLGMISQVYTNTSVVQVENLSWLNFRKMKNELLIPNTINFFVIIDSTIGIFLGEVYQSKIPSSNSVHDALINQNSESIYPEISIKIIGILDRKNHKFKLSGFQTVGLTDKVYIANREILNIFLKSIEVKKNNDDESNLSSFAKISNMFFTEVLIRPSTLFDRHLMTVGTTNSGKSTTSLSILDKLIKKNKKVLIIDPTGEYSESFSDVDNMQTLKLGVDTTLDTGRVSFSQWATLFETNDSTQPAVLSDAIKSLRYQRKNEHTGVYKKVGKKVNEVVNDLSNLTENDTSFDLSLLSLQIIEEAVEMGKDMQTFQTGSFQFNQKQWLVQKVNHKLSNTKLDHFFSHKKNGEVDLIEAINNFLITPESSLYINVSTIGVGDGIGAMIIDLISSYILDKKEKDNIAFVFFIDEVHRYFKNSQEGIYQSGLKLISKEGRKKGIFLFLTTQNPHDVPKDLLGQIGTLIIHRLTQRDELESIKNFLSDQSYKQICNLNRGEAIMTSINLIQDLHLKILKCERSHENNTTLL